MKYIYLILKIILLAFLLIFTFDYSNYYFTYKKILSNQESIINDIYDKGVISASLKENLNTINIYLLYDDETIVIGQYFSLKICSDIKLINQKTKTVSIDVILLNLN